ncbi:MAG TPA: hypothetical protein VF339_02060 [Gammaproteobacteria bacterium]
MSGRARTPLARRVHAGAWTIRRVVPSRITALAAATALATLCAALLATSVRGQDAFSAGAAPGTFEVVDVYVESARPLAAWQFELEEADGRMRVVGIEGGEAAPFADAPYYDRDAVDGGTADRIIVANFSLLEPDDLPVGHTRVASVHVRVAAGAAPDYRLRLIAAGTAGGRPIDAEISFDTRNGRRQ